MGRLDPWAALPKKETWVLLTPSWPFTARTLPSQMMCASTRCWWLAWGGRDSTDERDRQEKFSSFLRRVLFFFSSRKRRALLCTWIVSVQFAYGVGRIPSSSTSAPTSSPPLYDSRVRTLCQFWAIGLFASIAAVRPNVGVVSRCFFNNSHRHYLSLLHKRSHPAQGHCL